MSYASLYFHFTQITIKNADIHVNINLEPNPIVLSHGFVKHYNQIIQSINQLLHTAQLTKQQLLYATRLFSLHYVFLKEPTKGMPIAMLNEFENNVVDVEEEDIYEKQPKKREKEEDNLRTHAKQFLVAFLKKPKEQMLTIVELEHKYKLHLDKCIPLNILYIANEPLDVVKGFQFLRKKCSPEHDQHFMYNNDNTLEYNQFLTTLQSLVHNHIMYIDTNNQHLEQTIAVIYKCIQLNPQLCVVVKINNTFEKKYVEFIYQLMTMYPKISIIKPAIANIFSLEKIILCKNTNTNINSNVELSLKSANIVSHIYMPYLFMIKLNEINVILGQHQIDTLMKLLYYCKEKTEKTLKPETGITLKPLNNDLQALKYFQKGIEWCIANKIPYNAEHF